MIRKIFGRLEEILGAVILAIMAIIAFLNVVVRYGSNYSFAFTEEIVLNFFVWITLLGVSISYKKQAFLAMTFLYDRCSKSIKKIFYWISTSMSLAFFTLLAYWGYFQTMDEYEMTSVTEALQTPTWLYTIAVPVFSCLIIIRIIQSSWKTFQEDLY